MRSHQFKQEDWTVKPLKLRWSYFSTAYTVQEVIWSALRVIFSSLPSNNSLLWLLPLHWGVDFPLLSYSNSMNRKVTKFFFFFLYIGKRKLSRTANCGPIPCRLQPLDHRVLGEWCPEYNEATLNMSRWQCFIPLQTVMKSDEDKCTLVHDTWWSTIFCRFSKNCK